MRYYRNASQAGVLTPDDFGGAGVRDERRAQARMPIEKPVAILPCGACGKWAEWRFEWAWLVDCSRQGLGLFVTAPLVVGEQFLVEVCLKETMLAVYTVKHSNAADDGQYHVGAELSGFVGSLDEDPEPILDALLES